MPYFRADLPWLRTVRELIMELHHRRIISSSNRTNHSFDRSYTDRYTSGAEEPIDGSFAADAEEHLRAVHVLFSRFDTDGSTTLSISELRTALINQAEVYTRWSTLSAIEETRIVLSEIDEDSDERVSRSEFMSAVQLYLPHEHSLSRDAAFVFADITGGSAGDTRRGGLDEHLQEEVSSCSAHAV